MTGPDLGVSIRARRLDKAQARPQDDLIGADPRADPGGRAAAVDDDEVTV